MKLRSALPHLLTYACFLSMLNGLSGCTSDEPGVNEDVKTELLNQINALRKSGCTCGDEVIAPANALEWNTALEDAAAYHAADMSTNNYFSHQSLDGTSHIDRVRQKGYDGDYVGEVIARKYFRIKDVIAGWKESESHCRTLMDSLYNEMGGASKNDYWVVDFGRSK